MGTSAVIAGLDLVGTFVFAMSGALAGRDRGADLFGALVLAFVTAAAGGVVRDLIIGSTPPAAFADWHTLAIALLAGALALTLPGVIRRLRHAESVLDAAGLGVFAVTGTQKALEFGVQPVMAAVLGMVSGIGGGMIRDVLTGQVPLVLRGQIYALAALAGAVVVLVGRMVPVPADISDLIGVATCLTLRLMAIYRHWELPMPLPTRPASDSPAD